MAKERKEAFGFRVELDQPLLKDLEVHYGLETNKHVVLSGNPKDVSGAPESNNNGTYSLVIPAGERSKFIPLIRSMIKLPKPKECELDFGR